MVTGNLWGAGTSASIYLTIFGERGDTGPRLLYSGQGKDLFRKGKVKYCFPSEIFMYSGHIHFTSLGL